MVHPLVATALSTPMTTTEDLGKLNITRDNVSWLMECNSFCWKTLNYSESISRSVDSSTFLVFCDNLPSPVQWSYKNNLLQLIYVVLRLIFHQFNPYFRRDAEDSDWIRILTMLGLSAELYNDLNQENINNNCPSKLICQAFESRDILGSAPLSLLSVLIDGFHFRLRRFLHEKNLPTVHFSPVPNWWWLKWQQTYRKDLSLLLSL